MCDIKMVGKLFEMLVLWYFEWVGGYIWILKVGFCYGDFVFMVVIEFVDWDEEVKG